MKTFNLLIVLLFLTNANQTFGQNSEFKLKKEKYGYFIDGKMVIDYKYEAVSKKENNLYGVKLNGLWGVIDDSGLSLIDYTYETLNLRPDGEIIVSKDGLFGVINAEQQVQIDFKFDRIIKYASDSAYIVKLEGKWGLLFENEIDYDQSKIIFKVVDEMPLFDACDELQGAKKKSAIKLCAQKKMLTYIYENLAYPIEASKNKTGGTVVIRFVVSQNGSIVNSEIIRDVGDGCGEEALKVVNSMEPWVSGKMDGEAVNTYFYLPIKFRLER